MDFDGWVGLYLIVILIYIIVVIKIFSDNNK